MLGSSGGACGAVLLSGVGPLPIHRKREDPGLARGRIRVWQGGGDREIVRSGSCAERRGCSDCWHFCASGAAAGPQVKRVSHVAAGEPGEPEPRLSTG